MLSENRCYAFKPGNNSLDNKRSLGYKWASFLIKIPLLVLMQLYNLNCQIMYMKKNN